MGAQYVLKVSNRKRLRFSLPRSFENAPTELLVSSELNKRGEIRGPSQTVCVDSAGYMSCYFSEVMEINDTITEVYNS